MNYYDAGDFEVCYILDDMAETLTGDRLVIFEALRAGVSRQEIATELDISMQTLRKRISRLYQHLRCHKPYLVYEEWIKYKSLSGLQEEQEGW